MLGVAFGCATRQVVALDCVPHEVTVFVDGRQLERGTPSVKLERDAPHTLYFKGGVYEPQLVVLESVEGADGLELAPSEICSHTAFVPLRPDVQMELDTSVSEGPPKR